MPKNTLSQTFLLLPLFAFIAILALLPLASNIELPFNGDFYHHLIAISQAKMALLQGQFPLRVFPSFHYEWLYPNFQFYGTTTYTIAGFLNIFIAPNNPLIAFKITLACAIVFGGIYMYRLANVFLQSTMAAILSSICFVLSPYLLLLMNHLAAFNEAVALLFLPATIYYTLQRYYFPQKILYFMACSFFWYLLATTHLITFVLSSFFVGLFFILITCHTLKWVKLLDTGIAYAFGVALALWHLAPIFLFADHLSIQDSFQDSGAFFVKSLSIVQLLSPVGHIAEILKTTKLDLNTIILMNPNMGLPILLGVAISIFALFKKIKIQQPIDAVLPALLFLFLFAFFLAWTPFNFWKWLPNSFQFMQYPHRILGQCVWLGALLFGFAIRFIFAKKLNLQSTAAMILLIILSSSYWLFEHQYKIYYPLQIARLKEFNTDYLMDIKQNSKLNSLIDNMEFESNVSLNQLKSAGLKPQPFTTFYMVLKGYIANIPKNEKENAIGFFINGELMKTHPLKLGPLFLSDPVGPTEQMQIMTYKIVDKNKKIVKKPEIQIPIEYLSLRGLIHLKTVLSVKEVKPYCRAQKNTVHCELNVRKQMTMLELPVFYFPEMLAITVNGKSVSYRSVFYHKYLVAAIIPTAGKNVIDITFTGLVWANYLSLFFWGIWLLIGFIALWQQIFLQKQK